MREEQGRSRQVRCWKMDISKRQLSECTQFSIDALSLDMQQTAGETPTMSITADDDEMRKIITSKVTISVAEQYGLCHLKWGDDGVKRELSSIISKLNSQQAFVK